MAILGGVTLKRVSLGPGGRIDVRRQIEDFNIIASLTDNTVRDYDAAPWLKDALLTADKKISSASLGFVRVSSCSCLTLSKQATDLNFRTEQAAGWGCCKSTRPAVVVTCPRLHLSAH